MNKEVASKFSGMKILVTGGLGFIGSQLVRRLYDVGCHVEVVDKNDFSTNHYLDDVSCKIHELDLICANRLYEIVSGCDAVFHLAASGNVIQSIQNPMDNFNNNVLCTLNVLEAMRLSGCSRLIFSSTGGALMGNTKPPVSEVSLPSPISPYGASKAACESYIEAYSACFGIDYTIFRFGNVIGRNSLHKKGVLQRYHKAIRTEENIKVYGNPTRDFISADDVVNVLLQALTNKLARNQKIQLGTGVETPIRDLARSIIEYYGTSTCIQQTDWRPGEVETNYADTQKFKSIFMNYKMKSFQDTLRDTLKYLDQDG